jgi:hypothetical protein
VLLHKVFGFADIGRAASRTLGAHLCAVTLEARGARVPVVVVAPVDELDAPSSHLPSDGRSRSANSALQDCSTPATPPFGDCAAMASGSASRTKTKA